VSIVVQANTSKNLFQILIGFFLIKSEYIITY